MQYISVETIELDDHNPFACLIDMWSQKTPMLLD